MEWRISMSLKRVILSLLLSITILTLSIPNPKISALSLNSLDYILLSQYKANMDIGDEFFLIALTTNGKAATWKSSNSSIASVNTYGVVTAKKSGTAIITAKIKNAEASCYVTINKTKISLSSTKLSIERGETVRLTATTSNGSTVKWKSQKSSIASIDEYGRITGIKPGETIITATADGSTTTCFLTVKSPTIQLNKTSIELYRNQTHQISAKVSSNVNPKWKSNKSSVAIVDQKGNVTAIKNGIATITATVDGISQVCEVIVQKPEIILNKSELTLKKGTKASINATVSSNNTPVWTTSNSKIVTVNSKGEIKALEKGTAYIYASEDGTKVRCTVRVTE